MRAVSRAITYLVIAGMVTLIILFVRSRLPATELGQQFMTHAKFRDASKLVVGSPVVIAGIRIGEVSKLTIEGQLARVDMRLRDDTDVPFDSFVTKRAPSTFGDSYVEIIPAGGDRGASIERRLQSGEPITHVIEGSSTDTVLRATAQAMPRLEAGVDALHDFMVAGRSIVNGTLVDGLTGADSWLEGGHLHRPLQATDEAFEQIERATQAASDALGGTDKSLQRLARIEGQIADARSKLRSYRTDLVTGFADTRAGFDAVDAQLAQAREITTAIANGSGDDWKGSLGRMIDDPTTADGLEETLATVGEGTSIFSRFKAYLGVRVEMSVNALLPRIYLTTQIRARNDKFYLVEISRSLLGGVPTDTLSDSTGSSQYTRVQSIDDELRFTFQIGKVFGPLALRGGIKDSTLGAGADYMAGGLTLTTEVFGSFSKTPNLKFTAAYEVFRSVYLIAGIDDTLNTPGDLTIEVGAPGGSRALETVRYGRDYFLGAQLRFNDQDIVTLLQVYGAALAGLL